MPTTVPRGERGMPIGHMKNQLKTLHSLQTARPILDGVDPTSQRSVKKISVFKQGSGMNFVQHKGLSNI
jgi:hypothetical protein